MTNKNAFSGGKNTKTPIFHQAGGRLAKMIRQALTGRPFLPGVEKGKATNIRTNISPTWLGDGNDDDIMFWQAASAEHGVVGGGVGRNV